MVDNNPNNQGASGNADSNSGNDGGGQKVTFTPEQQAVFDARIKEAMGRAAKDVKEENSKLNTQLTDLQRQLEELKASSSSKAGKKEGDGLDPEVLNRQLEEARQTNRNVQAQLEDQKKAADQHRKEAEAAKAERLSLLKKTTMQAAAGKLPFIKPEVVTTLTESFIQFEPGSERLLVVREDGTQRMNSTLDPMSLDEFYQEFARENQYLVRSDMSGGTGQSPNSKSNLSGKTIDVKQIFGKESNGKLANELKKQNPTEYSRLKSEAISLGLI
jgi:hypothetical protein